MVHLLTLHRKGSLKKNKKASFPWVTTRFLYILKYLSTRKRPKKKKKNFLKFFILLYRLTQKQPHISRAEPTFQLIQQSVYSLKRNWLHHHRNDQKQKQKKKVWKFSIIIWVNPKTATHEQCRTYISINSTKCLFIEKELITPSQKQSVMSEKQKKTKLWNYSYILYRELFKNSHTWAVPNLHFN